MQRTAKSLAVFFFIFLSFSFIFLFLAEFVEGAKAPFEAERSLSYQLEPSIPMTPIVAR